MSIVSEHSFSKNLTLGTNIFSTVDVLNFGFNSVNSILGIEVDGSSKEFGSTSSELDYSLKVNRLNRSLSNFSYFEIVPWQPNVWFFQDLFEFDLICIRS